MPDATEDRAYYIKASDLTRQFVDVDGDAITLDLDSLTADSGQLRIISSSAQTLGSVQTGEFTTSYINALILPLT